MQVNICKIMKQTVTPGVILSEKENSAAECLLGLKDGSQITPKKERTDRNSSGNGEIISHFNKSDKQLAAALPASENQVKNILANMGLPGNISVFWCNFVINNLLKTDMLYICYIYAIY